MMRLTILVTSLAALAGCSVDLPPPQSATPSYPAMDPADPASITAWEASPYNFGDFKIEIANLGYFQDDLGNSMPQPAKPALLHVYGAKQTGITPGQRAAIDHLIQHEAEIHAAVRKAVYSYYRESYPAYKQGLALGDDLFGGSPEEVAGFLPEIETGNELDTLVQLGSIYVHPEQKGSAAIGIEFAVPFDEEHGIGLRLVGMQVSAIGTAHEAYAPPQGRSGSP